MDIAERKDILRKLILSGKSRNDMADAIGVSGAYIRHILNGIRKPSSHVREKIDAYVVTLEGEADTFDKKVRLALLDRDMEMSDLQCEMGVSKQALNYAIHEKQGYGKLTARVSLYLAI